MSALERLQAHYKSLGRQSIDVSALMGERQGEQAEPLVFYWNPLTPAMRMEMDAKGDPKEHPSSFAARVVVALAIDENGSRLFKPGDEAHLRNTCSSHVLQEVAAAMIAAPKVSVKN